MMRLFLRHMTITNLFFFDLQELWFVSDFRDSRTVFIFHDLLEKWSIVYYTWTYGLY